jgi:hypothetical protein
MDKGYYTVSKEKITEDLKGLAEHAVKSVLEFAEDEGTDAAEIAKTIVQASLADRPDLVKEAVAQLESIAARTKRKGAGQVMSFVEGAFQVIFQVAKLAL